MSMSDPLRKITIYPLKGKNTPSPTADFTSPIECSTWDIKDYYKPLSEARKIPVPSTTVRNFDALFILNIIDAYKQDIQNCYEIKSPLNFYAIIRTSDTKEAVLAELNKLTNFFQDRDAARNIQEGSSVRIGNKGNIVFYYCPVFTNLKKFHIDFGVKKEQSILVPSTNMEFRLQLNYVFEFERDIIKSKKDETTKIMPIRKDTEPEEVIPILDEEENPLPTDADKIPPSVPLFQLPHEQAEQLKKSSISQFNSEHKYIEKTVEETLENIEKCENRVVGEPDGLSQVLKEEYKKIEENNQKKLKEEEERLKNSQSSFTIAATGIYTISCRPYNFTTGSTSNFVISTIGVSSQYTGTVDENGKVSDIQHVGDKLVPSSVEEAGKKFQKETEEMKEWEKKMVGVPLVGEEDEDDNSFTGRLRKEAEKVANKEVWKEIGNDNEVPPIEEQIKNEETRRCALGITKKEEEQRAKENWKTVSREEFYGITNKGKPVSDKMNNYDTFAPVFQKDYITKERCFQAVSKVNGELPKAWKNATKGFYVKEAIDASLSDETILLKKQNLLKEYAKQFGVNEIYQPSEVANMTVYKVSYIKHHILHENGIKFILSKNEDGLVFYGDKPLPEKGLTRFVTKSYKSVGDAITDLSYHQKNGILVVKEISAEEYAETLFPSWVPRNDLRVRFYVIEPEKVKEEPRKIKIDQENQTTWSVDSGKSIIDVAKKEFGVKTTKELIDSIEKEIGVDLSEEINDLDNIPGLMEPDEEAARRARANSNKPSRLVDIEKE